MKFTFPFWSNFIVRRWAAPVVKEPSVSHSQIANIAFSHLICIGELQQEKNARVSYGVSRPR